ncbi:MAG: hypothetical protein MHM6MM_006117 [Cercozoa sp. M6MM]
MRMTVDGAPFICKPDSFFGVRCGEPAYFHGGKLAARCLCPSDKPCLIGNGDTALCSSRFWLGHCDPGKSACVPQLQLSSALSKTLFASPTPTLDNGLGGECISDPDCIDPDLMCTSTCLVDVADSLFGTAPSDGFDVTADQMRDLGDSNVCALAPSATVPFNSPCLCNDDCSQGTCMVLLVGSLDDMFGAIDDTSLVGKCLLGPGATGCTLTCHCLPGSDCIAGECSIPAGSSLDCTSTPCTPPATCDGGLCKLPGGASCVSSAQCASGFCDPATGKCTVPPPSTLDPCGGAITEPCPIGHVCQNNVCVFGAGCTVDSDCGSNAVCVLGICMAVGGQLCNEDLQCQSGLCDLTTNMCSPVLDCSGFTNTPAKECCNPAGSLSVTSGQVCVIPENTVCTYPSSITVSSGGTFCVGAGATLVMTSGAPGFNSGSTVRFYGRPGAPVVVTKTDPATSVMNTVTIGTSDAHIQHTRVEYATSSGFRVRPAATGSTLVLRNLASFCTATGLLVENDDGGAGAPNRVTRFQ